MQRRNFLSTTALTALGSTLLPAAALPRTQEKWFDISLAQWSHNKAFFSGELDNLDFARVARERYGLGGIEYVSQFFKDKAQDLAYLRQMKQRAEDHGVRTLLIMIDGAGNLGATDASERHEAVENHHQWVEAAYYLGCHSIRVNARGQGSRKEVAAAATEGLRSLSEYAKQAGINVIVENHGGYSSDGQWLSGVIAATEMDNCGTLPDFGNFCIEREPGGCANEYDRYKGVDELMSYAKAVSAKSYDFDDDGEVIETDYARIMDIVKEHGYRGWVGIEYEGHALSPEEGIRKTIAVLEKYGGRTATMG